MRGALPSEPPHEARHRLPDLPRRVLLDEMGAPHGDLLLVGPPPAELALRPGEDRPRVRADEQLRPLARGQPPRVAVRDGDDVGGLAPDRDLPRPRQGGTARLAGLEIRAAVDRPFRLAEAA